MSMQHWTKLRVNGDKPPARSHHVTCCIACPLTGQQHPLLVVIGGRNVDSNRLTMALGDVWLLDVNKEVWSEVGMLYLIAEPANYEHANS